LNLLLKERKTALMVIFAVKVVPHENGLGSV